MDSEVINSLQRVDDDQGQVVLLQLISEAFDESLYLANDTQAWDYESNNYIALPFAFKLPESQDGSSSRAQLAIDNVGRGITEELEKVLPGQSVWAKIMVMQKNPTGLLMIYSTYLPINNVSVNETLATADCGIDFLTKQKSVKRRFTPKATPGIF